MTEKTPIPSFEEDLQAALHAPAATTEFVLDLKTRLDARLAPSPQNQSAGSPSSQARSSGPERDEDPHPPFSASPRLPRSVSPRLRVPASPRLRVTDSQRPFYLRPMLAAPALVLLTLLVTVLAVGPQRVLAAVRGLFGYIPGVGIVEDSSTLRILAEPASLEREGITLQVQAGAADAARTIIVYQVDGLSVAAANSQGEAAPTGGIALLALPDGSVLTQTGSEERGWGTGYQARLVFPALPPDVNEFTLVIERLETMPAGAAPEDWRIPLALEPAPSDITMLPVYELAAAEAQAPDQTTALADETALVVDASHGIQLTLDRVVETENGFQLQGHTSWEGQPYSVVMFDPWFGDPAGLVDGQGNPIPFEETQPDYSTTGPATATSRPWAIQTNSKAYPGPWTLTVTEMQVYQPVQDPSAVFNMDFGAGAQIGQTWQLDQTVQAAGFNLHAVSASLHEQTHMGITNPVLEIVVETDKTLIEFSLDDPLNRPEEGQSAGAGLGWHDLEETQHSTVIGYYALPAGKRSLQVQSLSYTVSGAWEASWTPPALTGEAAVPVPEQACLTAEAWRQAVDQPASLPTGLSGRLLVEQHTGQLMPQMVLLDSDGSDRQDLVIGGWSSLSPDGSTAAYIESNGPNLMLLDIASGQSRPVPGSTPEDYHAVFSLDGQWLAFVRSNDGIYISRPDGSGRRQVVDASRIRFLVGWLPDNHRLVMTSLGPDGSQAQLVDVESGEIQDLFNIDQVKGGFMKLSPDGSRLAYSELAFGTSYYSIYVSNLDGSDKRLAAALDGGVTSGAWSPDGQWLAVSVSSSVDGLELQTAAILQPDTCQVIPLPGIEGNIVSWVNNQ